MVNGFRELNPTGKYLRNVGKLIQQINVIQKRNNSEQHPLLYVSENVKFEADKVIEVSDCYEGIPPYRCNASDFSPCKRDRLYWINVSSSEHSPEEHVVLFSQSCFITNSLDPYRRKGYRGKGDLARRITKFGLWIYHASIGVEERGGNQHTRQSKYFHGVQDKDK